MPCTPSFLLDAPSTVARGAHLPERRMASLGRHAEFTSWRTQQFALQNGALRSARRPKRLTHGPRKGRRAKPASQRAEPTGRRMRAGVRCATQRGLRASCSVRRLALGAWRLWAGEPSPLPGESSEEPTWRCQRPPLQSRQYKYTQLGAGMEADLAWPVGGRTPGRRLVFRLDKTRSGHRPRRASLDKSMTYQLGSRLGGCFRQTSGNGTGWSNCS